MQAVLIYNSHQAQSVGRFAPYILYALHSLPRVFYLSETLEIGTKNSYHVPIGSVRLRFIATAQYPNHVNAAR